MRFHLLKCARLTACIVFAAAPAIAGDYYVDAVHGDDANAGFSQLDAWRTLTHAMAAIPLPAYVAHTVHVAPGTYGPASGEVFPLEMRPGIRLIGTQGSAATILEGPADGLLSYVATSHGGYWFDAQSGAEGLTLRNAMVGIVVTGSGNGARPTFRDLVLRDSELGVRVWSSAAWPPGGTGEAEPTFDHVLIADCTEGIEVDAYEHGWSSVILVDCAVRDCTSDGIALSSSPSSGGAHASLARCRIIGNHGNGVYVYAYPWGGGSSVDAEDSLFAGNGDSGLRMRGTGEPLPFFVSLRATHCTIANNVQYGAVLPDYSPTVPSGGSAYIWNSILSGNAVDLDASRVDAHDSDSADGALLGWEGCIAADAVFVDPAAGDYRLAFGSPCIDTASPDFMTSLDLLGQTRPFDGNLDTIALPDMGAMEFAPLYSTGFEPGSTRLMLELSGPDYGRSVLYLSDAPLLRSPETTPFGSFFLVRSTAVQVPIARIQSRTSNLIELKVPAALVPGSTITLQALIRSHAAPAGAAFSNPLEFVIAP